MAIYDISKYKRDKEEHIEDFERATGIQVIDHDIDSLDELEDEFDDFQQMTYKQRKVSNAKSEELYGVDNYERYNKLKSKFLKYETNDDDDTIIYTGESNIIDKREPIEPVKNTDQDIQNEDNYQEAIKVANQWTEKSMIYIITPQDSMIKLEELWNNWNSMHLKHRRDSDMKSIELFNMTNKDHYEKLKSVFLRQGKGIVEDEPVTDISISSNEDKIKDSKEKIETHLENGNILSASKELLLLKSLNSDSIYENTLIKNIENYFLKEANLNVNSYYDKLNDLPYFTPEQLTNMGVYFKDTFYDNYPDNKYLDDEEKITTKDWFDCYNRTINGFLNEDFNKYTSLWINKLNTLYRDYDKIKESGDIKAINARKQSILELGWNPEIDFNLDNRKRVSDKTKNYLKSSIDKNILDIREFYNSCEELDYMNESDNSQTKYPMFVVLSYSGKGFSKIITRYTKSKFSHASLGLEPELDKLYSYNLQAGGFDIESLDIYKKNNSEANLAVFCTFLDKEQIKKVRLSIDQLLSIRNDTRYSIKNLLGIGLNMDFESNLSMICSQFVDRMLKMVNIDHTNKPSGLVTPNDFYINKSNNMYLLYDGPIMEYNPNKARMLMKKLDRNSTYLKESSISIVNESSFLENMNLDSLDTLISIDEQSEILSESNKYIYNQFVKPYINIYYYNEAKEFPIQFDKDGNLLIKNMKRLNYETEYNKCHKLLMMYDKSSNIEGMKYELSKLWFLNTIIEGKIYNEKISDKDKNQLYKTRARILNDFNKYMKVVNLNDKEFNFTNYYNESPFSDVTVKISKHTIKHGVNLAKLMVSNILV